MNNNICSSCNCKCDTVCGDCSATICTDCISIHNSQICQKCNKHTCFVYKCNHNVNICKECYFEWTLIPNTLTICNNCYVSCPCSLPIIHPSIDIKCNHCTNIPFVCYDCSQKNNIIRSWEKCNDCAQKYCPLCYNICESCMHFNNNPDIKNNKPYIVCNNCADLHSHNFHNANNIIKSLKTTLDQPEQCLVCYEDVVDTVAFPGCKHDPKLCINCAQEMNKLKCIINCTNAKSFVIDIWATQNNPISINSKDILVIDRPNNHPHKLLWKNIKFSCDKCLAKEKGCYVCLACDFTLCVNCSKPNS